MLDGSHPSHYQALESVMNTIGAISMQNTDAGQLDQAWLHDAYQAWKQQPKLTIKELFEIFPESAEVVETNLREEQQVFAEQVLLLKERITEDRNRDEFTRWFLCELRKHFIGPALEQAWHRMERYRRELSVAHGDRRQETGIKPEDIADAKAVTIESLIQVKRSNQIRVYAHCPFHDDKTPSFVIYKEENTFHCFGCGAHGDVMDFVMRRDGLSFRKAIRMLIGR